jgi:hypothetical protein
MSQQGALGRTLPAPESSIGECLPVREMFVSAGTLTNLRQGPEKTLCFVVR